MKTALMSDEDKIRAVLADAKAWMNADEIYQIATFESRLVLAQTLSRMTVAGALDRLKSTPLRYRLHGAKLPDPMVSPQLASLAKSEEVRPRRGRPPMSEAAKPAAPSAPPKPEAKPQEVKPMSQAAPRMPEVSEVKPAPVSKVPEADPTEAAYKAVMADLAGKLDTLQQERNKVYQQIEDLRQREKSIDLAAIDVKAAMKILQPMVPAA